MVYARMINHRTIRDASHIVLAVLRREKRIEEETLIGLSWHDTEGVAHKRARKFPIDPVRFTDSPGS